MNNEEQRTYLQRKLEMILAVENGEATWSQVAEFANRNGENVSEDTLRKGAKDLRELIRCGLIDVQSILDEAGQKDIMHKMASLPPNKTENADGSASYDRKIIRFEGDEELTKEEMLKFFNLSPEEWFITTSRCNMWEGMGAGGGKERLYQLKINVRPKTMRDLSVEDIDACIERNAGGIKSVSVPAFKKSKKKRQVIKQIDLADIHWGLLAWKPETGEHYNLKIASQYTMQLFRQFVERNRDQRVDKIVLVTMGDIIHVDNGNLETAHGTRQDADSRVPNMLDTAVGTLVNCIRMLEELKAPIEYVYVPGNHDQNLGYAVARMVQLAMSGDPNVTFDVKPAIYKCLDHGRTSVLVTHGEANNKRLVNELLSRHREVYGRTGTSEVHAGHLHSQHAQYEGPTLVRRVPAVCESSYWEHSQGYAAVDRGMQAFTYWSDVAGCISVDSFYTHENYACGKGI